MTATDLLGAPAYRFARAILGAAARVYFRRIEVRHRERVPVRGSLLVVANHPASFTDVILLSTAIPRRLQFLAMAPIFKPWIRGFALRLGGALPVYRRQDDPSLMDRNQETFRASHEILDRGGAVLIFPEGTSLTDRRIVDLKTGAARLALGQEARPGQEGSLTLLPVGLHFAERAAFRSAVVVSVGRAVDLARFRDQARTDGAEAVRALTAEIQSVLEKLILNVPDADRAALVDSVERLYRDETRTGLPPDVPALDTARGIAECIEHFAGTEPERVVRARALILRCEEHLSRLRLRDRAVREMLPARGRVRERARLLVLGLLGVGPALLGGLFHIVPYRLCGMIAGRVTSDPTQVASVRIGAAVVLFPLTYGAVAFALARGLGWPARAIGLALLVLVPLGLHALAYFTWLAHQRERIRLVLLKVEHRRLIAKVRRERQELIRMFEDAQRKFLVATRPGEGRAARS